MDSIDAEGDADMQPSSPPTTKHEAIEQTLQPFLPPVVLTLVRGYFGSGIEGIHTRNIQIVTGGMTVEGNHIYVSRFYENAVHILNKYTGENLRTIKLPLPLQAPSNLALAEDRIFVVTGWGGCLRMLHRDGSVSRAQSRDDAYKSIAAVDQELFVLIGRDARFIKVYHTSDLRLIRQYSSGGGDDGNTPPIDSFCIDGNEIYGVSMQKHKIVVMNRLDGRVLRKWGSSGTKEGLFRKPRAIAVSGEEVFVADSKNHRIQVFTKDGEFLRSWGSRGDGNDQFEDPDCLLINDGELYVADSASIKVFR